MYKILLCYAQTHKYIIYTERLRERQSITVQKKRERAKEYLCDEEGKRHKMETETDRQRDRERDDDEKKVILKTETNKKEKR